MATVESEGAALVGGAAAAAACGDSRVATVCADNMPAKRSAARVSCSGDETGAQFRRLEREHGAEADLIVVETEYVNRAVILPVQIITANRPESSDHHVERGLDKVIVVVSISIEAAERAEVVGVLIADIEADVSSLEETLACSECDGG